MGGYIHATSRGSRARVPAWGCAGARWRGRVRVRVRVPVRGLACVTRQLVRAWARWRACVGAIGVRVSVIISRETR